MHPTRRQPAAFGAAATVALVLAVVACSDSSSLIGSPEASRNVVRLSEAAVLLETYGESRGVESEFLRLEVASPGFGGFYLDSLGDVVAVSTGETPDQEVLSRLKLHLDEQRFSIARRDGSAAILRISRGRAAFSTLLQSLELFSRALSTTDGVVFLDSDERRNRLRIGLSPAGRMQRVLEMAADLAIDTSLIYVESLSDVPKTTADLNDKFRPAMGAGIAASAAGPCSMGFHVTDSTGGKFFLTAGHCTNSYDGATGIAFWQNDFSVGNIVGSEAVNPAWSTIGCMPGIDYCRLADVALVAFDSAQFFSKRVAQTWSPGGCCGPAGTTTIGFWFPVVAQGDVASGAYVQRTGRSSGTVSGTVLGTCLNLGPILDGTLRIQVLCANEVAAYSQTGDSGGPVYLYNSSLGQYNRQAVGIHFASARVNTAYRAYFSSISAIQGTINRTLTYY